MTLNDTNVNESTIPRTDPSPLRDGANQDSGFSRREFVGMAAASLLMAGKVSGSADSNRKNGIPYRPLGHTGEQVSVIGLGGYHLARQSDPEDSLRIIRTGIDEGINFLDNCWDYNGGESEIRMGKALRDGYRQKAFLMTRSTVKPRPPPPPSSMNRSGGCRLIALTYSSSMK